jgi:VIT1/CCC1 family predicted Fe2+/Mn2+ transporter
MVAPSAVAPAAITAVSLLCLVALGGFSAVIGGAPPARAAFRVAFWGALAMGLTAGAGWVFGLAV